jgi:ATPase subunit of ABC transporter with duplicated ATPase domains
VRALNAITTFGVGQRIGIMAGSGVGKSVLLDMIAHGASAEIVIVGLIGERARSVRFRRAPYGGQQARHHRRHRRARRPCAQPAHSRRDAGHIHGRTFPRRASACC